MRIEALAALAGLALLSGCGPQSSFGFRLPDGDASRGRIAFAELRCNACHEVDGGDIAYTGSAAPVTLGGDSLRIKTHGELVTSIINPSHRIAPRARADEAVVDGESRMATAHLNDVMTVQQLVDLVAFLQPTYKIVVPPVQPGYWRPYP